MNINKQDGFTLVELIVVISIIALLAGIVIASLSGRRNSSKYTARLSDLGQLNVSVVDYQLKNASFPSTNNVWFTTGTCTALSSTATSTFVPSITYAKFPKDPDNATNCTQGPMYAYKSNGTNYKLIVYNAKNDVTLVTKNNQTNIDPARNASSTTPSYGYWSTGASAW